MMLDYGMELFIHFLRETVAEEIYIYIFFTSFPLETGSFPITLIPLKSGIP